MHTERHHFHFLLRVDEGHIAATRGQNQLRLVLEQDLDDLVRVSQKDGLLRSFPFLDVDQLPVIISILSNWSALFAEVVQEWLKLLVAVQVALEVLQEHDFLVDRLRVVKEVEWGDQVGDALSGLSICVNRRLLFGALNVIEVE